MNAPIAVCDVPRMQGPPHPHVNRESRRERAGADFDVHRLPWHRPCACSGEPHRRQSEGGRRWRIRANRFSAGFRRTSCGRRFARSARRHQSASYAALAGSVTRPRKPPRRRLATLRRRRSIRARSRCSGAGTARDSILGRPSVEARAATRPMVLGAARGSRDRTPSHGLSEMSGLVILDEYRDGGWHRRVTRCAECKKELRTSDEWRDCRRQHFLEAMWRSDPALMRSLEQFSTVHSEKP